MKGENRKAQSPAEFSHLSRGLSEPWTEVSCPWGPEQARHMAYRLKY